MLAEFTEGRQIKRSGAFMILVNMNGATDSPNTTIVGTIHLPLCCHLQ
jgi:hypothetical protein